MAGPAPGEVQPGRPADRGRPQDGGIELRDASELIAGRCAPAGRPAARSRRSRSVRTGERSRPSPRRGMATIWDRGITIAPPGAVSGRLVCRRREHQRGRDDARHGRRGRREALGRRDRRRARPHRRRPQRRRCRLQPDRAPRRVRSSMGTTNGGRRRRDLGCSPPRRASRRCSVDTVDADVLGWAVAFSPDGRMLATGGIDPLVHLWDVRTGKLIRELEQNVGNAVWALEFSPDGRIARHLRRRLLRVPLGRRHGSADRPEARGRQPRGDARPVARRTPIC